MDKNGRCAGCLMFFATFQFILMMVLAQVAFPCVGGSCYNLLTNPISDLGNTSVSPLWPIFNFSIVIFGACLFAAALLAAGVFRRSQLTDLGLFAIAVAGGGAAGVGVVPENTVLAIHSLFALVAFWGGGAAIILLGVAMLKDKNWRSYAMYSIISGIVVFIASAAMLLPSGTLAMSGPGLGFGGVERLVAAPTLLWLLVVGAKIARKRA